MRYLPLLAILISIGLTSCVSLSPKGAKVDTTKNQNLVEDCESLGSIVAHPPYSKPNSHKIKLRNKAGLMGGDMVLITETGVGKVHGTAYKCGNSD